MKAFNISIILNLNLALTLIGKISANANIGFFAIP